MSTNIWHIHRNTGQRSHLCKTPFFEELSHIKENISRCSSASASYSANVKAWQVQRGIGTITLTLSSSCFPWQHCTKKTQKKNSFFCLPILLPPQNHSLHQPVSLSLPGKGLEILKQNSLSIQNYQQLTAPKQCNEGLAQQRNSEIHTDLRAETCSQTTGKKCFSRAKDQYHANHYDKQARFFLA